MEINVRFQHKKGYIRDDVLCMTAHYSFNRIVLYCTTPQYTQWETTRSVCMNNCTTVYLVDLSGVAKEDGAGHTGRHLPRGGTSIINEKFTPVFVSSET